MSADGASAGAAAALREGRLAGRTALITGGGNGLGLAMARLFAAEGARVVIADRDGAAAAAGVADINAAGGQALGCACDVTREADIAGAVALLQPFGRLDVLVNNAGTLLRADFRHTADADWAGLIDIHVMGAVRTTRACLPLLMAAEGRASVVNLSSIMASRHARQLSAYSTAKAAVAGLSRALAVEFAPLGIRVNYLCPGFIPTAMTGRYTGNEMVAKGLLAQIPARRFGTPEEVARAALFFASDDSAYTTGQGLAVDGGMSLNLA